MVLRSDCTSASLICPLETASEKAEALVVLLLLMSLLVVVLLVVVVVVASVRSASPASLCKRNMMRFERFVTSLLV